MFRSTTCTLIGVLAIACAARAADSAPALVSIDDFEDGDLIAAPGSAWVPIGDDLMGGKTTFRLEATRAGANESRGALRLSGVLGEGPDAFAGAWTAVAEGGRGADVSRFSGFRLRLRGGGEALVGVRGGPFVRSVNFMARVKLGPEWSVVEVPFSSLRPQGKGLESELWDPGRARWFGVQTVPGAGGRFSIEVDDVAWIVGDGPAAPPVPAAGEPETSRALVPDDPAPLRRLAWRELARDAQGDGRPGLPDARALFTAREPARSLAWFRIDLQEEPPAGWIGVNLVLDIDGDPANGPAWWGMNAAFHYDRLVTAWVFRVGDRYEGTVGIASGDEVTAMRLTNDAEVHLALDRRLKRVYLGVPVWRIPAAGGRVVAAVGSAMFFGDDLPNEGSAPLDPPQGPGRRAASRRSRVRM